MCVDEPAEYVICTSHTPVRSAAGAGRLALSRGERTASSACNLSATTFSSPGDNMYGVIETPVFDGSAVLAANSAMRGSVSNSVRAISSPDTPNCSRFHHTLSVGVRFDSPSGCTIVVVTPSAVETRLEMYSRLAVQRFHSAS